MKTIQCLGIALLAAGLVSGAGAAGAAADDAAGKTQVRERKQAEHKACREKGGRLGEGLARELGLSDEKTGEIRSLMQSAHETLTGLRKEREQANTELRKLLAANPVEEAAVMAAAKKLAQVEEAMIMARVKARLAVSAALTAEQRARLAECREKAIQRFKERREKKAGPEHKNRGGEGAKGQAAAGAEPTP